jgi:hypothetical protein
MNDPKTEFDDILNNNFLKEDINVINKIIDKDERRKEINAKYYQKHREQITKQNALRIYCKLCKVKINKGSYQLHKKSRLHKNLLQQKLDFIEEESDEENN